MRIEQVDIKKIKPYENNPRINKKSIDKVANSLLAYGWRQPIVVDKNMIIVAGHTRFSAARQLKLNKVPVHIADNLNEQQIKAYRLADNRSADDSEWNFDALKIELESLIDFDPQVDLAITTCFDQSEINSIMEDDKLKTDLDKNDEILFENNSFDLDKIVTKEGMVWVLDKHKIICGDSTKKETFTKLFNNSKNDNIDKADMIFTDPPYNVDYEGHKKIRDKISNDKMTDDNFFCFLKNVFDNIYNFIKDDASLYICYSTSETSNFLKALDNNKFNKCYFRSIFR
jgi:16S rRNA G966 N2-methylase RsmD